MNTSGVPKDLCDIVDASGRWMSTSDIPELPISADPVLFWSGARSTSTARG